MRTPLGRDGRPLVDTAMAAYSLGMKTTGQFREWARRRGIRPAAWQPNPARGQALALWDLCDIGEAVRSGRPAA
ncbi:hypothetical protein ACFY1J_30970 [Streptomyces sp. NPDC001406]|uniref:hypothetical protein n=1 Tax=Streptomyces sp. NPDC001406 TaxID=3364572 RepID=UPI0036B0329C